MHIAIFLAHPRGDSFCHALALAYLEGATSAGAEVELLWLDNQSFDPILHERSPRAQPLEPSLEEAKRLLIWADHLVFVFPTWWATMPALLKGFFDRILVPGFAFHEDPISPSGYRPLLGKKSARIITTMDTPGWIYRWIYGRPGELAMKRGILGFCGIKPVRMARVCNVKNLREDERLAALQRMRRLGLLEPRARELDTWRGIRFAWIRAMRLPFQGMTICSYGLGAAAAIQITAAAPAWPILLLGFLSLAFIAIASVFLNEVHDLDTDRRNQHAGPFTGGSRVLVDESLSPEQLKHSAARLLGFALLLCIPLLATAQPDSRLPVLAILTMALLAGPGYTAPPLRLVYRGLGEPTVALTHTLLMALLGWLLAGGDSRSALPWLISLPACCSVLSAIILAGVPDADADRQAGKQTLAVRFTPSGASIFALLAAISAPLSAWLHPQLADLYQPILIPATLHTLVLLAAISHFMARGGLCQRVDALLFTALTHILWFTLGPLLLIA